MSKTHDDRGTAGDGGDGTDRLDLAIDRTVREMLDVEPPAGLRRRVIGRISEARGGSGVRRHAWILAPLAAAAVIALAVLLPWRGHRRLETPGARVTQGPQVARTTPPSTPPPVSSAPLSSEPASRTATPSAGTLARPPRAERIVRAAVIDATPADPAPGTAQVAALDGPAPLAITELTGPPSTPMKPIDVAPIQIAALEVNALSDLPRERQREE